MVVSVHPRTSHKLESFGLSPGSYRVRLLAPPGSNVLTGSAPEDVDRVASLALDAAPAWTAPPEYLVQDVSRVVSRIVLGHLCTRRHHTPEGRCAS